MDVRNVITSIEVYILPSFSMVGLGLRLGSGLECSYINRVKQLSPELYLCTVLDIHSLGASPLCSRHQWQQKSTLFQLYFSWC